MEVTLFRFALISIALFAQSSFGAPNTDSLVDKKLKKSPFKAVSYSKSDRKFGLLIYEFNRNLKRNKINRSNVINLRNTHKKTSAFPTFKKLIKPIIQLSRIKNNTLKFSKSCNLTQIKDEDLSPIATKTKKLMNKYCRRLFINILTKQKNKSKITFSSLDFLKQNISHYLSGESHDLFVKYLKRIDENSNLHNLLSELITENYIQGQLTPRKQVLSQLKISPQLTTYVQEVGLGDQNASNYFNNEFMNIRNSYKKSLREEKYIEAQNSIEQLLSFYSENSIYISQKKAWIHFLTAGKDFLRKDRGIVAEKLFRYAHKISNSEQNNEASFQLLWRYIYLKDYSSANNIIEEFKMIQNFSEFNSKVKFWISYTLLKIGEDELSEHLFTQLTKSSPLNFYTIISLKTLNNLKEKKQGQAIKKLYKKTSEDKNLTLKSYSPELLSSLKRLHLWLDLKYNNYSYKEVNNIITMNKSEVFANDKLKSDIQNDEVKKHLITNLIKLFNHENQYLHTFKLLHSSLDRKVFDLNSTALKHLFPFPYMNKIKKMSGEIDPFVILSLIRQESAFNPEARSGVGARGLMQLMPATARQYSSKRLKISKLKKPDINIKIGVRYFTKLLKMFDGNLIYALASYNAGENRVKRWRKNIFKSEDPLHVIEGIPYKETRKYVKLIYRNIFFYNLLSDKSTLAAPLDESFQVSYYKERADL